MSKYDFVLYLVAQLILGMYVIVICMHVYTYVCISISMIICMCIFCGFEREPYTYICKSTYVQYVDM